MHEGQQMDRPLDPPPPIGRIRAKSCDVRGCVSNSLRNPDLLFVGVPTHSYPERRFVWLTLMQAARDKKRSYCCSRHFTVPDDFKDFQEFINAPPGYKRQLMVKKGVVPHLNMPPLNLSALPPLTNRWPMTLPVGLTETDKLEQAAAAAAAAQHNYAQRAANLGFSSHHRTQMRSLVPGRGPTKFCKAVQTDPRSVVLRGDRKVQASLQYCRLCFTRHDLEPIFTGDQTLIEPDLIDKIYGCTEIMISVEYDFPSSICAACYSSVQDFMKFRKLVQTNDQTLRTTVSPEQENGVGQAEQLAVGTSVRTKTTKTHIPRKFYNVASVRGSQTVPSPCTTSIPVRSLASPPTSTHIPPAHRTTQRDDPLLEVSRVEDLGTYERVQQPVKQYHPRVQRIQQARTPCQKPSDMDPLASAEALPNEGQQTMAGQSSQIQGVQMRDRVVPVTLIRIEAEHDESNEEIEQEVDSRLESPPSTDTPENTQDEDATVKLEEDETREEDVSVVSSMKDVTPNPPRQPIEKSTPKQNVPKFHESVQFTPTRSLDELRQKCIPRPARPFPRPFTVPVKRFEIPKLLKVIRSSGKQEILKRTSIPSLGMVSRTVRAVKFPGTLTTLFSRPKVSIKPIISKTPQVKLVSASKTVETQTAAELPETRLPEESPKIHDAPQVLKEVSVPKKPTETPRLQTRIVKPNQLPQKENNVPRPAKLAVLLHKLPVKNIPTNKHIQHKSQETDKNDQRPPKGFDPRKSPAEPLKYDQIEQRVRDTTKSNQTKWEERETFKQNQTIQKEKEVAKPHQTKLSNKDSPKPDKTKQHDKETPKPDKAKQKDKESTVSSKEMLHKSSPQIASPRSPRARKVPLKFQNTVGFPKPKIVVKPDQDVEKSEHAKEQEKPQTRFSSGRKVDDSPPQDKPTEMKKNVAVSDRARNSKVSTPEDKSIETKKIVSASDGARNIKVSTLEDKSTETKKHILVKPTEATKSKPGETKTEETKKLSARFSARRSDPKAVNTKSPTPQKVEELRGRAMKRKSASETNTDPIAKEAPASKSPKLQDKRTSVEPSTGKGKQQEQRANGSRKSAPAEVSKKKQVETSPAVSSSQDWKCPFCSDKIFEQKKGLVKHLRKRHGMDYALVRQRLAIYGGNWR